MVYFAQKGGILINTPHPHFKIIIDWFIIIISIITWFFPNYDIIDANIRFIFNLIIIIISLAIYNYLSHKSIQLLQRKNAEQIEENKLLQLENNRLNLAKLYWISEHDKNNSYKQNWHTIGGEITFARLTSSINSNPTIIDLLHAQYIELNKNLGENSYEK